MLLVRNEDGQADSGATPPTCHHETVLAGRTWLETPRVGSAHWRSTVLEAMPPEESFVARMGQGVFYHGGELAKAFPARQT